MAPLAASTMVVVFILVPLAIVWVIGVVDIVRRDLPFQAKAAWITVVLLVPFLGVILYFVLRKPSEEELRRRTAALADQSGPDAGGDIPPGPPVG